MYYPTVRWNLMHRDEIFTAFGLLPARSKESPEVRSARARAAAQKRWANHLGK